MLSEIEKKEDRRLALKQLDNLLQSMRTRISSLLADQALAITLPDLSNIEAYDVLLAPGPTGSGIGDDNVVLVHKATPISPAARFKFKGTRNFIVIGAGVDLSSSVVQCNGRMGCVVISDRTKFKECKIITAQKNTTVLLGSEVTWGGGFIVVQEPGNYVAIGDKCMFSWEIGITPSDGHPIYDRATGLRINPPQPIIIQDTVWLGRGVRIGKGVNLGRCGVIGQMSLVTKDTRPFCVYAGVPARLLRENIEWRHSTKEGFSPEETVEHS